MVLFMRKCLDITKNIVREDTQRGLKLRVLNRLEYTISSLIQNAYKIELEYERLGVSKSDIQALLSDCLVSSDCGSLMLEFLDKHESLKEFSTWPSVFCFKNSIQILFLFMHAKFEDISYLIDYGADNNAFKFVFDEDSEDDEDFESYEYHSLEENQEDDQEEPLSDIEFQSVAKQTITEIVDVLKASIFIGDYAFYDPQVEKSENTEVSSEFIDSIALLIQNIKNDFNESFSPLKLYNSLIKSLDDEIEKTTLGVDEKNYLNILKRRFVNEKSDFLEEYHQSSIQSYFSQLSPGPFSGMSGFSI